MTLLILRPEPGASATAARARALGLHPIVAPLFEIRRLAWDAPDPARFDAVAMTSANAARHGGAALARYTHLPLFAVGETTAEAARAIGFHEVSTGRDDAAALGEMLAAAGKLRVLHVAGEQHRDLAGETVAVYRAEPLPWPDLPDVAVALLHSPRAAAAFAAGRSKRSATAIVAISARTAEAAGGGWRSVAVAGTPTDDAMLALAARLCE